MIYDYAVVGGGVAGLSTALILANCGFHVAVVEKGARTASMVRGFSRQGLHFDTGFHYAGGLGEGECFDRFCRYLGIADRLKKVALDPDGFDTVRCRRPDFEFRFSCGPGRLRERLNETFPTERIAIDSYLREIDRACATFPFINIDAGFEQFAAGTPESGETLQEVLDRLTNNRLLQSVLSTHTLLHGVPPRQIPFALHALVAGPYYQSAHTLKGGGRNLAEAFDTELSRRGVEIYSGEGARAIELSDSGRPTGVRLAGGKSIQCRGCVFTAHPWLLPDLLPEKTFRPVYRKRLRGMSETPSACLLFGGVDTLPEPLTGGNLFLLEEPESAGRLGEKDVVKGPLYLTAAHSTDAQTNKKGYLAIAPIAACRPEEWSPTLPGTRPPEYGKSKDETVRQMQKRLADFYPGMIGESHWCEGATPLTLRDYGHTPTGSMYGVSHQAGQIGLHSLTRVPGLLLAGQAVAAPGVMGALISALLACGHIVGFERIWKDLHACR